MELLSGELKEHRARVDLALSTSNIDNNPLEIFTPSGQPGVGILRLSPYPAKDVSALFVMHINGMSLYGLVTSSEVAIGWVFVMPKGDTVIINNGIVYVTPLFNNRKGDIEKKARKIGNMKGIDPEIYMSHNDFCIMGIDSGSVLLIARNQTNVMTQ